jgi:hypothetical protein
VFTLSFLLSCRHSSSRNLNKFSPLKRHEILSLSRSLSFSRPVATHKNQSWHATGANKKKEGKSRLARCERVLYQHTPTKSKLFACSFVLAKITYYLVISRFSRHLSER